jgi:hypothetical protein
LRGAHSAKTDPAGRYSVDALIGQGQCWKFVEQGVITGAMVTAEEDGDLWVLVAAGRSQTDLSYLIGDYLKEHAAGRYRGIVFRTARRGLVKKALSRGYEVETYIMRKKL